MIKYLRPCLFIFSLALSGLTTQAQSLVWATQFKGGPASKHAEDIIMDAAGNVYTVGGFEGVVDFDPGPGVVSFNSGGFGTTDIFIVKQSPNGSLLWARQIGAGQIDVARDAEAALSGFVDVGGDFRRTF